MIRITIDRLSRQLPLEKGSHLLECTQNAHASALTSAGILARTSARASARTSARASARTSARCPSGPP